VKRDTTFNLRREPRHRGDSDREKEGVRHRRLTYEEQRRLEKVMDPDLADMVLFDLETGMREEELCTLTWGQIEWSLCQVTFELKVRGRDPVMHTVDLIEEAMAILYRRLAMHEAEGVGVTSNDRVFMLRLLKDNTLNGKTRHAGDLISVSPRLLIDRFRKARKAALIDDLVVHDLRRTAGRRVYDEEGSDIEAARAFLGHVDVETTKRYLGVTGTSINKHLRRRSARARLAKAELDAAAANAGAAPGTREHALHLVVGRRNGPPPADVA
jgi:integrase